MSDGVQTVTPRQSVLHRALHDGSLLCTGSAPVPAMLIRAALRWPEEEDGDDEEGAEDVLEDADTEPVPVPGTRKRRHLFNNRRRTRRRTGPGK